MPQFELEKVGASEYSGIVRARTAEIAVREAAAAPADGRVSIQEADDFAGWSDVLIDGIPSGRIRPHQRMRFRRA